ncbi:MAG TPA: phospholipase A [Burkholderiaceae bacterium]|jgi:outer membrane phospholipase A|nr:phospholipase A [Burkholderiaceae bacterium]
MSDVHHVPPARCARLLRHALPALAAASLALAAPAPAHAAVALLAPPRMVDGTQPLVLNLLVTADAGVRAYDIPETLEITASAAMQAPVQVIMRRQTAGQSVIRLRRGEYRQIAYTGILPPTLRGVVRIEPTTLNAAPVLVTLNLDPATTAGVRAANRASETPPDTASAARNTSVEPVTVPGQEAGHDTADSMAHVPVTPVATAPANVPAASDLQDEGRLSFFDPMYLAFGQRGGTNAKFQLSFKYRIFQAATPTSKGPIDNLYFGYTQFSLWDLSSESKPFYDTNYRPSVFYYLPDTGVKAGILSRLAFAGGLEHESNGRSGTESRSINTVFIKPTFYLGDLNSWHATVTPKLYYYLSKSDNRDIADYRGYADLRLAWGKPDSWELAATLRKGTKGSHYSADTQVSYPLAQLLPGTAGYLVLSYFTGYGESLLDYNRKRASQVRIGYSISR